MSRLSPLLVAAVLFAVAGCQRQPASGPAIAETDTPAAAGSRAPRLAQAADGRIVLSWVAETGDGHALRHARWLDDRWSPATTVAHGDGWFVNWADLPSVVPIDGELWAAHWLRKSAPATYAYDVVIALSRDGGNTWPTRLTPHTDGTATEHGFVSLFADGDGVGALWLDGRETAAAASGHGAGAHSGSDSAAGMTLRAVSIDRHGALQSGTQIDDLVCDCCPTDVALSGVTPIVIYRDRSVDEVRDIAVARRADGRWQSGIPVGRDQWQINACPVNGPAIAAHGERVAVSWFTAAGNTPQVRFAWSDDGGETFAAPVAIDTGTAVGRVALAVLADGSAAVAWLRRTTGGGAEIAVRRVGRNGAAGQTVVLAEAEAGRRTGIPQMVRDGDALIFAWTHWDGDVPTIRSARLAATALPRN